MAERKQDIQQEIEETSKKIAELYKKLFGHAHDIVNLHDKLLSKTIFIPQIKLPLKQQSFTLEAQGMLTAPTVDFRTAKIIQQHFYGIIKLELSQHHITISLNETNKLKRYEYNLRFGTELLTHSVLLFFLAVKYNYHLLLEAIEHFTEQHHKNIGELDRDIDKTKTVLNILALFFK